MDEIGLGWILMGKGNWECYVVGVVAVGLSTVCSRIENE